MADGGTSNVKNVLEIYSGCQHESMHNFDWSTACVPQCCLTLLQYWMGKEDQLWMKKLWG